MTFDPKAYAAGGKRGFDPKAYAAGGHRGEDTFKTRGVRQPDGSWLVQTPDGPVRLDDAGNLIETVEDRDVKRRLADATSREETLAKVLATTQGGAQGFVPQVAGLVAAAGGGDYELARNQARRTVRQATEEAGIGYEIAGGLISGGLLAPETAAARIALAGGLGAANAAADSDFGALETLSGAGLGLVLGGAGEGLAAGARKVASKMTGKAAEAVARQTARDAAEVESEIASLTGKLGGEKQKASRLLENIQRAATGTPQPGAAVAVGAGVQREALDLLGTEGARDVAESVAQRAMADFPGQKAVVGALEAELEAAKKGAAKEALDRTAKYFATPLWQSEIAPRLRTLAPRFGLAAAGAAMGEAYDAATGGTSHTGAFVGAVLGAPGVRAMMKNVASSRRVQFAVGTRLAPLLDRASALIVRGITPTIRELGAVVMREESLGNPDLAAEQLVARGGLASVIGAHPQDVGEVTGINAPQTELDAAIHQTVGVVAIAGALDDGHRGIDKGVKAFLKGEYRKPEPKRVDAVPDLHRLAASPQDLVDRLANNTGSLSSVAPGVTAAMSGVAQRAVEHLASLSAQPPPRGPLAPPWAQSASERRLISEATAIADDPMRLLELATEGRLSAEHMKTAAAIYPVLTRAIGDRALDLAIEAKGLTRKQRLMLSVLTGVDVDGGLASLAPNQRVIQARSTKPSNAGGPDGPGAPPAKTEKLTMGQRTDPHAAKEPA